MAQIGFSNSKTGWFSTLIRFFTKSKISHSFVMYYKQAGQRSVIEADIAVLTMNFDKHFKNDHTDYIIFDCIGTNPILEKDALNSCFVEFAGTTYGFSQCIWFMYRWLAEVFKIDVTHQKNWMTEGVICSELVWHFLDRLGPKFSEAVAHLNPDTTNAEDILKVVRSRPDLFKPIETNPKAEAEFLQWVHQNS